MRKRWHKRLFHISWLWLPYLLLFRIPALPRLLGFVFMMLSIHELAHIVCARWFHYPLQRIILYPFGLCAQIGYLGYGDIRKEACILLAGPLMHLWFPLLFSWLTRWGMISAAYAQYLCLINMSLLLFNLLPIYPLDGGRLLQCVLHSFLPYRWAQRCLYMLSILMLLLFAVYGNVQGITSWGLLLFLCAELLLAWRHLGEDTMWFYRYRLQHPVRYRVRLHRCEDIFRSRRNVFRRPQGFMEEEEWLRERFFTNSRRHTRRFMI